MLPLYHLLRLGAPVDFGRRGRSRSGGDTHHPPTHGPGGPTRPTTLLDKTRRKKKTRSPRVPLNTYPAKVCSFLLFMTHASRLLMPLVLSPRTFFFLSLTNRQEWWRSLAGPWYFFQRKPTSPQVSPPNYIYRKACGWVRIHIRSLRVLHPA